MQKQLKKKPLQHTVSAGRMKQGTTNRYYDFHFLTNLFSQQPCRPLRKSLSEDAPPTHVSLTHSVDFRAQSKRDMHTLKSKSVHFDELTEKGSLDVLDLYESVPNVSSDVSKPEGDSVPASSKVMLRKDLDKPRKSNVYESVPNTSIDLGMLSNRTATQQKMDKTLGIKLSRSCESLSQFEINDEQNIPELKLYHSLSNEEQHQMSSPRPSRSSLVTQLVQQYELLSPNLEGSRKMKSLSICCDSNEPRKSSQAQGMEKTKSSSLDYDDSSLSFDRLQEKRMPRSKSVACDGDDMDTLYESVCTYETICGYESVPFCGDLQSFLPSNNTVVTSSQ